MPGVIVTQHSGEGKANQYFLRGFNLDHGTDFATTAVGIPVNMPTHAHGQGYSDLNFLIPELVTGVQFSVDGSPVGPVDTTAPYSYNWDTTRLANGTHTLTAQATDAAGNSLLSAPVTVTVCQPGVSSVSPVIGATGV